MYLIHNTVNNLISKHNLINATMTLEPGNQPAVPLATHYFSNHKMRGFSMYHTNLPIMKWIFDIDLRKLWCPKYYSRYTKACKLMIIHVHVLPHTLCNFISFLEMLTLRQACCAVRIVPPPTVPTSIHGMVQLMYRSSWVGPVASIRVIQLLLATHWAGSCNITNMSVNHTSKAEINLFL